MARAIVREATEALGLDRSTEWELTLATTEAFANAVEHGAPCDPRGIRLGIEIEDGRLHVEIADCGCFRSDRTSKPEGHGGRVGRGGGQEQRKGHRAQHGFSRGLKLKLNVTFNFSIAPAAGRSQAPCC